VEEVYFKFNGSLVTSHLLRDYVTIEQALMIYQVMVFASLQGIKLALASKLVPIFLLILGIIYKDRKVSSSSQF